MFTEIIAVIDRSQFGTRHKKKINRQSDYNILQETMHINLGQANG